MPVEHLLMTSVSWLCERENIVVALYFLLFWVSIGNELINRI